jgi:ABC-type uncharacterized transport system permease subunit
MNHLLFLLGHSVAMVVCWFLALFFGFYAQDIEDDDWKMGLALMLLAMFFLVMSFAQWF